MKPLATMMMAFVPVMISVVDPDQVGSTSYCRIQLRIGIQGMPIRIMAVVSVMIAQCDGIGIFDYVDDDCGCGWNDAVLKENWGLRLLPVRSQFTLLNQQRNATEYQRQILRIMISHLD
jgi:hypothetical protein